MKFGANSVVNESFVLRFSVIFCTVFKHHVVVPPSVNVEVRRLIVQQRVPRQKVLRSNPFLFHALRLLLLHDFFCSVPLDALKFCEQFSGVVFVVTVLVRVVVLCVLRVVCI